MARLSESFREFDRLHARAEAGERDEVLEALGHYIARDDTDYLARFLQGILLYRLERHAEARQAYSAALFSYVYSTVRETQSSYLRPRPHPPQEDERLWQRIFTDVALRISEEDGADRFGFATNDITDADVRQRQLYWVDERDESRGTTARVWLIDGPAALYWLLRRNGFYATCLSNLADTVEALGDRGLAVNYRREALEFVPDETGA